MARRFSGKEVLEKARETIRNASNIKDLRQGQAVMLPLAFGLSMEETAQAIGVSKNWACQLRCP
jgi:hypothetical protein